MSDTTYNTGFGNTAGASNGAEASKGSVTEQARQAGAAAVDHARDVAAEARTRATSLAGSLKEQATSIGESQKDRAADALEGVAKAIHQTGAQLEGEQDWAARLVERGAAELNSLAAALRRNDVQGLIDNLGGLARRQPAVFVGASMAAGFLLTRIGRLAAEGATTTNGGVDAAASPASMATPAPTPTPATSTSLPETRYGQH